MLIAVHHSLSFSPIELKDDPTESLWIKVSSSSKKPIILAVFYRPPSSSKQYSDAFIHSLSYVYGRYPEAHFIIGGDFNLPHIDWDSFSVLPNNPCKGISQSILSNFLDLGFSQIVRSPTRSTPTSSSILDLIFTNFPDLVSSSCIIGGISDHDIPLSTHSLSVPRFPSVPRKIYLYHKANFSLMSDLVSEMSSDYFQNLSSSDVPAKWSFFKDRVSSIIDSCVPSKMVSVPSKPWFSHKIKRLVAKKQRLYNKFKRSKIQADFDAFYQFRRFVDITVKSEYRKHLNSIIDQDSHKSLFRHIKLLRKDSVSIPSLSFNNSVATSDLEKANILNSFFSSVFTEEPLTNLPSPPSYNFPPMPAISFSSDGICKLLSNLNVHSSPGPDSISNKFLKLHSHSLSLILQDLFTSSLNNTSIPHDWLLANVTPIHKKGSRASPNNYRPVSLTSSVSKIIEHIFVSQITTFLESVNFFSPFQHGFLKSRSCESQLLLTCHDFACSLNSKGQTDAIVLDFRKAFDSVPHHRLLSKLSSLNLHPLTLSWLRAFLSNRSQRVVVNGYSSPYVPVISGVPQGTVLGPLLFLIYINDISSYVKSSTIRLFADDCLLYKNITSINDSESLQSDLKSLKKWSDHWLLRFNTDKCNIISFTNKKSPILFNYTLDSSPLSRVSKIKYLGIIFDSKLTFSDHIHSICSRAKSFIYFLNRNLSGASPDRKLKAYVTYVRPIIEYASVIWNPYLANLSALLDSVQRLAIRFIRNNFSTYYSVTELSSGLNLPTLSSRRSISDLSMVYKIFHKEIFISREDLFSLSPSPLTRGHRFKLFVPDNYVNAFENSFAFRIIKPWNNLHPSLFNCNSSSSFKSKLSHIL